MIDKIKEFFPSSWSIDNKIAIYVLTVIVTLLGINSYNSLPKEKFPDIVVPTISVVTVYPGSSPKDIENIVTKPIEKQLKSISGVKKTKSNSVQDFSMIEVEFNTDVDVSEAKRLVQEAVDKSRSDLPTDLPTEPTIREFDFSEMPIMYINISGNYDLNTLKKYSEILQDKIEEMKQITRVDMIGALDREIQINIDMNKLNAMGIGLDEVERGVMYENMRISGGNVNTDEMKRSLSISGEFKNIDQIKNIIVRSSGGATVHLSDLAEIKDDFKEQESYARLYNKPVITLNVVKRSGENLILASDNCRAAIESLKKTTFPKDLNIVITGDQSTSTKTTLHDLINTIIIGFILVTIILMFFMGTTNAMFVGLSVPISMFLAFLVMPAIGFSLNMIVLFAFLLALGIVVDDAIVVIENTHRIFDNGKVPIIKAAKMAAGEVFVPVLAGTLTTLAPFVPLAFWGGIMGKFIYFLPVTLIITLLASLVVAYIINPVFAVDFMKPHEDVNTLQHKQKVKKSSIITGIIFLLIAGIAYISGHFGVGNFLVFILMLFLINRYFLSKIIEYFQNKTWPAFQMLYKSILTWCLQGKRPLAIFFGTIILLILTVFAAGLFTPGVIFFPQSDPNFVYTYIKLPVGTSQKYTDSITKIVEKRVYNVLGEKNQIVESVISNVSLGATDPSENDRGTYSNRAKVAVSFVEVGHRKGENTNIYLDAIRNAVQGIPGTQITVEKESNGPPTGKPISIEISGENLDELIHTAKKVKKYLIAQNIAGVEELKSDLDDSKPEIQINVDRERASREGISTAQIGMSLRNAVYGKEVSKFKDDKEEYPIMMRIREDQRNSIDKLMNLKISFRDMIMGGMFRQIPLSSIAEIKYSNTFGGIKRKNHERVVTISSNVLNGYNPNEVVANVEKSIARFNTPENVKINMGGEKEEQQATMSFLGKALMISILLIILILVIQFNSVSKPFLILTEIIFSFIGVLLGFVIFRMEFSIFMTGIGIVALAGIVVRNGILLVEFTDVLMERGMPLKEAIIEAGKTRMTPVLLTASATILGLIPLAIGLNIDFVKLFTELNPHIWFGGESVAFWGPLSWTMIFGLSFATFLTLILVPMMYYINEKFWMKFFKRKSI